MTKPPDPTSEETEDQTPHDAGLGAIACFRRLQTIAATMSAIVDQPMTEFRDATIDEFRDELGAMVDRLIEANAELHDVLQAVQALTGVGTAEPKALQAGTLLASGTDAIIRRAFQLGAHFTPAAAASMSGQDIVAAISAKQEDPNRNDARRLLEQLTEKIIAAIVEDVVWIIDSSQNDQLRMQRVTEYFKRDKVLPYSQALATKLFGNLFGKDPAQ